MNAETTCRRFRKLRMNGATGFIHSSSIVRMNRIQATSRNSYVRSLARGLSVICSFRAETRAQTVSQVAAATGLDRAGARRMLRTLETLGYVRSDGRKFQLTPRVLELAHVYLSAIPLRSVAEPILGKLVAAVQESCAISVLDGTAIVCVVTVPVNRIMTVNLEVGSRLPAYCTSQGRILLGGLSDGMLERALEESDLKRYTRNTVTSVSKLRQIIQRDRARGWSVLNEEYEEGVCSISVPIMDRAGQTMAALNAAGSLSRISSKKMIATILPRLKEASQEIHSVLLAQPKSVH